MLLAGTHSRCGCRGRLRLQSLIVTPSMRNCLTQGALTKSSSGVPADSEKQVK